MSWDIIVMNLPPGLKSVKDLPRDFVPAPLGKRSDIIAKISAIFPESDFSDPTWGILRVPGCAIEFSMGEDETVDSFAMHVRGTDACPDTVAHILSGLGMRALDPQSESGVFEQDPKLRAKSFERWRSFGDHIDDLLNKEK
jgi:hypothetical protein